MVTKVFPMTFNGEIHEDYIGVTTEKEYQIRQLELLIKGLKEEIKTRNSMLNSCLLQLNEIKLK